jgi:hypothetical protein
MIYLISKDMKKSMYDVHVSTYKSIHPPTQLRLTGGSPGIWKLTTKRNNFSGSVLSAWSRLFAAPLATT